MNPLDSIKHTKKHILIILLDANSRIFDSEGNLLRLEIIRYMDRYITYICVIYSVSDDIQCHLDEPLLIANYLYWQILLRVDIHTEVIFKIQVYVFDLSFGSHHVVDILKNFSEIELGGYQFQLTVPQLIIVLHVVQLVPDVVAERPCVFDL